MPDEVKNQEPTAGAGGDGTGAAKPVDQDTVNRLERRWRKEAETAKAQAAELQQKLTAIEAEKKSDQEKAIEAASAKAKADTDKEWQARFNQHEIDSALKLRLLEQQRDPDLAVLVKSKSDIHSIEDIDDAIKLALDGKPWAQPSGTPKPPAQFGAPSGLPQSTRWTPERIAQVVADRGAKGFTDEEWQQIKASGL